jgi:hypothetical protein
MGMRAWDFCFFCGQLYGGRLAHSHGTTVDGDQVGIDVTDLSVFGLNTGEVEAIN